VIGFSPESAVLMAGVAAGLRHALEPDHVAAVASFAARAERPSAGALAAAQWALAHGLVIVAAAAIVGVLAPARSDPTATPDLLTAATLVYLGRGALRRVPSRSPSGVHGWLRPWAVGAVHGLAGSGTVVLGVVVGLGFAAGLGYALALGVGALVGMVAAGLLIARTAGASPVVGRRAVLLADIACLLTGVELLVLVWRS
jgi:hypothetical protein